MKHPQVGKQNYVFGSYGFEGRFVSYFYQLRVVLKLAPASVLEIGVGDGVFGDFLKRNTALSYTSVDIAADLHPDVVASVTDLPFPAESFDVVCAFEVLEHLPFADFEPALDELCRVARKAVVVSLPHFGPMISFSLKIPFLPRLRVAYKIPYPRVHRFDGQHYWEIGKRGYPPRRIRELLRARGTLLEDFVPFNSEYHHFFVLAPRV